MTAAVAAAKITSANHTRRFLFPLKKIALLTREKPSRHIAFAGESEDRLIFVLEAHQSFLIVFKYCYIISV